jgi:hypothetical protein
MDGSPALTLGLEPIYDDLMCRKPTKRSDNIVSKDMLTRIGLTGAFLRTIPLDLMMWLKIFVVTFSIVLISELMKLILTRIKKYSNIIDY